tara:strand:+ start:23182 stop:26721 length:3540 start_codon:yes stop_codon:yes gene_type:complete
MTKKISNIERSLSQAIDKVLRTASVGHFNEVTSEEDMENFGRMAYEMVQLPKYEAIKRKLQSINGVVNFVTNHEYGPLAEFLLKSAFPPANNSIYHMGEGLSLDSEYFVDSTDYFGSGAKALDEGKSNLSTLFWGDPQLMDLEWLSSKGMDMRGENKKSGQMLVDQTFGSQKVLPNPENPEDPSDRLKFSEYVLQYSEKQVALEKSKIEINRIYRSVVYEKNKKKSNSKIEKENASLDENSQKPLEKVIDDDELSRRIEQFKIRRSLYHRQLNVLKTRYGAIVAKSSQTNQVEREGGFLSWNPSDDINEIFQDLKTVMDDLRGAIEKDGPDIQQLCTKMGIIFNKFNESIGEYRSTNPDLNKKLEVFKAFIKTKLVAAEQQGEKSFKVYITNNHVINRLASEIVHSINNSGQVMLFTNFENCSLVAGGEDGVNSLDNGVFKKFMGENTARNAKSKSANKKPTKKTIVLVSEIPVSGLEGSSTVEMKLSPVDEQEAAIIIKHISAQYADEAYNVALSSSLSNVQQKYSIGNPPEKREEMDEVQASIEVMRNDLGTVGEDITRVIEQMITGLGQRQAIMACQEAFEANAVREYDDDGNQVSLSIDTENLESDLVEVITVAKAHDTVGLRLRKSQVKFKDYISKKGSTWGSKVGDVAGDRSEYARLEHEILGIKQDIAKIDLMLKDPQLNKDSRKQLIDERKNWKESLDKAIYQRSMSLKGMPHVQLLYGSPGVGKSVWADALADACNLLIYQTDVASTKDKWLGETGKYTRNLIDKIFTSRRAVFLIDEIDRQIEMSEGSGGSGAGSSDTHESTKDQVSVLLENFGDRLPELIDRDVFVIMTTNHLASVDTALLSRCKGDVYEVEASDDPEDYLKYLKTFLDTEKSNFPNAPWITVGVSSHEEGWDIVRDLVNGLDLNQVAVACSKRNLAYRSLTGIIKKCVDQHNSFLQYTRAISVGDETARLRGLPLTTSNVVHIVSRAVDVGTDGGNSDYNLAVDDVKVEVNAEAQEILDELGFKSDNIKHHITGDETTANRLPAEVLEIMSGRSEGQENEIEQEFQFDVGDGKNLVPIEKGIKELPDTGFTDLSPKEKDPELQQQKSPTKITTIEEPEEENENETVKSSTDYLFLQLKKAGIIPDNNNNNNKETEEVNNEPLDSLEQHGVMYFNNKGILTAPLSLFK